MVTIPLPNILGDMLLSETALSNFVQFTWNVNVTVVYLALAITACKWLLNSHVFACVGQRQYLCSSLVRASLPVMSSGTVS